MPFLSLSEAPVTIICFNFLPFNAMNTFFRVYRIERILALLMTWVLKWNYHTWITLSLEPITVFSLHLCTWAAAQAWVYATGEPGWCWWTLSSHIAKDDSYLSPRAHSFCRHSFPFFGKLVSWSFIPVRGVMFRSNFSFYQKQTQAVCLQNRPSFQWWTVRYYLQGHYLAKQMS